jgi:A/G-specific adenine glycosylase
LNQFPASELLRWYDNNKRTLLWRENSDPYTIWVSEIMLQQTRVEQATPYFERFISRFPDVYSLAEADQQEVLKFWEGLGYYSRARNLHNGAKQVVTDYGGKVPETWNELRSIKGIGDYTASAILSISFNQPYGVLDGNVVRVLSRYLNHEGDVTKLPVKKELQEFCNEIVSKKRPGDFNQAIMELGATVCTPRKPNCGICPLNGNCQIAFTIKTDQIPYKPKKAKIPHHTIVVAIIVDPKSDKVLISKRKQDVMLGGLWEFPGGKVVNYESLEDALYREISEETGLKVSILTKLTTIQHTYSHFKITLTAFICSYTEGIATPRASDEVRWVKISELDQYPFPKANIKFLQMAKDYISNNSLK